MTWLLDGNMLVALAMDSHEFHDRARRWFDAQKEPFATCAMTEGTLLRIHMRLAVDRSARAAWQVLYDIHGMESHEFWTEGFSYLEIATSGITGWSDVTDVWLVELTRRKRARLATLDARLAAKFPQEVFLVPNESDTQKTA